MQENIRPITIKMTERKAFKTEPIYQYDTGHTLAFTGFTLPEFFEVHFSLSTSGESITQIGQNNVVELPDMYAQAGRTIFAWLFIDDGESGLTKFSIEIPVYRRAVPSDEEPTPVEERAIDQAIAALNQGVERSETAADNAEASEAAAEAAKNAAEAAADLATSQATAAAGSAQTAEDAARDADSSADSASESAQIATEKASEAAESAEDLGEAVVRAEAAAQTATEKAGDATSAARNASRDATAAGRSATAAEASETAAAGSAATASTKAEEADASATAAAQTKTAIDDEVTGFQAQLNDFSSALNDIGDPPKIVEPEETEADLYVCDSNGNVIAKFVDGHIVTKNFNSASIQLDLIMEADSNDADLYISDSFGNVVAEFKDGHILTKNFDSADMVEIPGNVDALQEDVATLQKATSGILYRNKDATDGVYAACRYHQPNLPDKQFCVLIAGDVHADRTRTQNMIEYLNAVDAFDAGIMLGDMSGNEYTDTIAFYLEALGNVQKPFLTVLGNHDVVGAASDAELYAKFGDCFQYAQLASGEVVSGKCYYYKDFTAQKIRIIVLMQYDLVGRSSDTGDLCFGQDQIDWFIGVLNSTPSDYGVIIAEHTNPSRHMTYNMDVSITSDTWRQSNYAPTVMDGDPVPDIVNAWVNGATLSQTYSYTFSNPPAPLTVSADFTSRGQGEFITYLGGHWHMDVLGTPTEYTNQPDYHTPAAGLSAATQGDIPRKTGTRSEDSLSAIAVDRDKKTVKVFHIGAHFTKDAVDRLYFKYSYGS